MQLRPLTLDDKPIFEVYASHKQTYLSSYAFAPIFIWRNHFQFYWTLLEDHLCVFAKQGDDYFMPIMPMGSPFSFEVVWSAFQFMLKSNRNSQIARIENVSEEHLSIF